MIEPEKIAGNVQPIVDAIGTSATRTGYVRSSSHSSTPFARAVWTYGLRSSSSSVARIVRMSQAVPESPITRSGTGKCANRSRNLPMLQGALAYSGEYNPPTDNPKLLWKNIITTSASRNGGTERPMNPTNVVA